MYEVKQKNEALEQELKDVRQNAAELEMRLEHLEERVRGGDGRFNALFSWMRKRAWGDAQNYASNKELQDVMWHEADWQ